MTIEKAMGDWLNTVSSLKWLFVILAVLAVAAVVILLIKKKRSPKSPPEPKADKPMIEKAEETSQPQKEPCEDSALVLMSKHIRGNADKFNGLYEGIYQTATNPANTDYEALTEWKIRIQNIADNDEFKSDFSNMFNLESDNLKPQAEKLLRCIELAGIKRSDESEYAYTLNSSKKYVCLSGNKLEEGTICTVLKPFWYIDGKVIEQGCIIRKDS